MGKGQWGVQRHLRCEWAKIKMLKTSSKRKNSHSLSEFQQRERLRVRTIAWFCEREKGIGAGWQARRKSPAYLRQHKQQQQQGAAASSSGPRHAPLGGTHSLQHFVPLNFCCCCWCCLLFYLSYFIAFLRTSRSGRWLLGMLRLLLGIRRHDASLNNPCTSPVVAQATSRRRSSRGTVV